MITAYAVCAHPRDAGCRCRKPRPGLVLDLAATYGVDLATSTLVGDTEVDRALASRCGIPTFYWAGAYFGHLGGDVHAEPGANNTAEMRSQGVNVLGREHDARMSP